MSLFFKTVLINMITIGYEMITTSINTAEDTKIKKYLQILFKFKNVIFEILACIVTLGDAYEIIIKLFN